MNVKLYVVIYLLLIVCGKLLAQAPETVWVSSYNGPDKGSDVTNDCVVDNQGNLYAVGSSENGNVSNVWDIIILKYDVANGDTIWTQRYNGPANEDDEATSCILDNSGNIFVVGYSANSSNDDFLIIKYNISSGDTIWTRKYSSTTNANDHASDCALDDSGNLFVTGISENGADFDYLTVKFNAVNGDTIWSKRFNSSANGNDLAMSCSLDGSGNLYVTGYSHNGLNYNILTIKYNENGDTLWTRRSTDTLDDLRFPKTDCITDISGNLYVIGMCGINENFQNRYSLITKYNSSGDLLWKKKYDGSTSYDQPLGCTLDDSGDLYVTGTSYDGNKDDCFTIKYNSTDGNLLWSKRYIGPVNSSYGISCTVDNSGFLYVTGQSETAGSSFDSFTIKYESTVTSVSSFGTGIPAIYSLDQNHPNPFNPTTKIGFSIPQSARVSITVYSSIGQEIAELVNGDFSAGNHSVDFDGSNLSSGIYFYTLKSTGFSKTMKMMLVK